MDNIVQKTRHQQQGPGNRRWDVIEVPRFLCVVLAYGSRHIGIRGYLGSDRLRAPPTKETFLTPFPGARPFSSLPPTSLLYLPHTFLYNRQLSWLPQPLSSPYWQEPHLTGGAKCYVKGRVCHSGWLCGEEKKNHSGTERQTRAFPLKVLLFWGPAAWHCLEPCYKGCVLGSTQTSWIRVCMFTITPSDS